MKQTHSIQDVEGLILEKLAKLRDSKDKKEQRSLRKEILNLERHFNDCNEKHLNGKKYPVKKVPKDIPKKELLALIDSVPDMKGFGYLEDFKGLDLSGVHTSDDRTEEFPRTSILEGKYLPT